YFDENIPSIDYRLFGYLDIPADSSGESVEVPRMGTVSDLADLLVKKPVHEVIAIQPEENCEWIKLVIEQCDSLGIALRLIPEALLTVRVQVLTPFAPTASMKLPGVLLAPPHFDSDALFFKRILDMVISAVLLVLLSPLFLVIAIAVKIFDRRSKVFYRWNVVGRNGVRFTGYKFTTMYADADDRRGDLLDRNE